MSFQPLPFDAPLTQFQSQAAALLAGHAAADPQAIAVFRHKHPRFLDEKISWLPKDLTDGEIASTPLTLADAQLAAARAYDFQDWAALAEFAARVEDRSSPEFQFESAVEAMIHGDASTLRALLNSAPDLAQARSRRVTHFDPPVHRATLLHYVAANGVEGFRQKTPANALEITRMLLEAGADAGALANLYGGECSVLSMLVSSCHPAEAGLQGALAELLIDFGASLEADGKGHWQSPLMTALVFGYLETARTLARRGARVDDLAAAAGLGLAAETSRMLPSAGPLDRHRALAISAQLGHEEIVRRLLDAGEDPNRFNPDNMHSHATPLHQAAFAGHEAVVRLLVERGARLDVQDTVYNGTPLGWARHAGHAHIERYLH